MAGKQYGDVDQYENKLQRVMERFGVDEFNFDWSRQGGWVEFRISGVLYRFDHSVEKAQANGQKIKYGSDAFAQLVLALEDLARLAERGIYKIQVWIEGMRFLPPPQEVPECFRLLGFESVPEDIAAVTDRFRQLAKKYHSDTPETGDAEMFKQIKQASEDAKRYLEDKGGTQS